ncbi:MAG: ribosome maturation factor RimM [Syntrophales bacterium]
MGLLEIGRIVRCHGLTGRLKVLSHLESPDVLEHLSEVFIGRGARDAVPFPLEAVQPGRGAVILKLGGVEDRDAAAKLIRSSVWIPSEVLKELPEGEYYWSEIIGLRVVSEEGNPLGRIESVFPTGSNDVYVCRGTQGEILLPAVGDVIRKIDIDGGIMVVRVPEGLTEACSDSIS